MLARFEPWKDDGEAKVSKLLQCRDFKIMEDRELHVIDFDTSPLNSGQLRILMPIFCFVCIFFLKFIFEVNPARGTGTRGGIDFHDVSLHGTNSRSKKSASELVAVLRLRGSHALFAELVHHLPQQQSLQEATRSVQKGFQESTASGGIGAMGPAIQGFQGSRV